uniref:Ankyrin repeat protein n=1 Tax=Bionectria ochroleuca TaxID=29856 RepID=A0A8H7NHY0_BIOOC
MILGMLPQLPNIASLAATNTKLYQIADGFLYQKDAREESLKAFPWAARNGQINTLRKALNEVDDINFIDENGNTPLYFAIHCFAPIVDAIIESLITASAYLDSAYGHPVGTPQLTEGYA